MIQEMICIVCHFGDPLCEVSVESCARFKKLDCFRLVVVLFIAKEFVHPTNESLNLKRLSLLINLKIYLFESVPQ